MSNSFQRNSISNEKLDSFDNLRYDVYHKTLQVFDLEKFPATSSAVKQHILRAYLQCHIWLHAAFIEDISIDPFQNGYTLNEEDDLVALIINYTLIPPPCNCLKCARPHGCPCRVKQIACNQYCKCEAKQSCKLFMNCHARSVYIGHFLLILSKNVYIYLGKI